MKTTSAQYDEWIYSQMIQAKKESLNILIFYMELDFGLVFELQSQLCFTLTIHHMFTIKNADDTGDGLFSFIELYNLRLFYFAERTGDW